MSAENEKIQRLYAQYRAWFLRYLDEVDPIDLLIEENPGNEYSPEVDRIIPLVAKASSTSELASQITQVFAHMFKGINIGPAEVYERIAAAAREKWRALREELQVGVDT